MKLVEAWPILLKYRTKGLLLDTNLLLLYFAGRLSPEIFSTFKPITNQGFTAQDFELLQRIVALFSKVVSTPHILTEISNHSDKLKGNSRRQLFEEIGRLVQSFQEESLPSNELCVRSEFKRFGLTDTAISAISPKKYLVLTIDFPLTGFLRQSGVDVINFNNLRPIAWD